MDWKNHLFWGVIIQAVFIIVSIWMGIFSFSWFLIPMLFINPLVPDLDTHGVLREKVTAISLLAAIIGLLFGLTTIMRYAIIMAAMAFLLRYTTHHRGYTHTILFCILYSTAMGLFFNNYYIGYFSFVGSYSHLVVDGLPINCY